MSFTEEIIERFSDQLPSNQVIRTIFADFGVEFVETVEKKGGNLLRWALLKHFAATEIQVAPKSVKWIISDSLVSGIKDIKEYVSKDFPNPENLRIAIKIDIGERLTEERNLPVEFRFFVDTVLLRSADRELKSILNSPKTMKTNFDYFKAEPLEKLETIIKMLKNTEIIKDSYKAANVLILEQDIYEDLHSLSLESNSYLSHLPLTELMFNAWPNLKQIAVVSETENPKEIIAIATKAILPQEKIVRFDSWGSAMYEYGGLELTSKAYEIQVMELT